MVARVISQEVARRLAISAQRLAGPRPPAGPDGILELVRTLGRLQLDPTSIVARSHLLVLWSRLGPYGRGDLDQLLWHERALFEYQAFIVPTEDYPLYAATMRRWPSGDSLSARRVRDWLKANDRLRRHVLTELRRRGPLRLRDFEDRAIVSWQSGGWTADRNVSWMLEILWAQGKVLVAGREGGQRVWDIAERVLPDEVRKTKPLPWAEAVRRAGEQQLRQLGLALPGELRWFLLPAAADRRALAARLADAGRAVRVAVEGLPGEWYVHADHLPLLERLEAGEWEGRTTLLSPFDTLIHDRQRAERLFGFHYRIEIYVPREKRRYGYFVMPLLHGDRLVGRIDPAFDRRTRRLRINALHWEPGAPRGARAALRGAVEELADFLGAERVDYASATTTAQ